MLDTKKKKKSQTYKSNIFLSFDHFLNRMIIQGNNGEQLFVIN